MPPVAEVQRALRWAGLYDGALDGQSGPATRAAIDARVAAVGGNVYDILMISVADIGYLEGPIYRDAGPTSLVLLGGTLIMTAVLAAGLLMRDRKWIGFEGVSIPLIYVGTVALAVVG